MRCQQNLAIVVLVVLALGMARVAWGLAGEITSPALACPVATNGDADPVVVRINQELKESTKSFAHGRFINAHTVLEFRGDTRELNAMLERLAKIDGVEISVRFSSIAKDSQPTQLALHVATDTPRDFAWSIHHSAWNDPHLLTITINEVSPPKKSTNKPSNAAIASLTPSPSPATNRGRGEPDRATRSCDRLTSRATNALIGGREQHHARTVRA